MTVYCALQVVKGIVEGCRQSDCALLGGEVCKSRALVTLPHTVHLKATLAHSAHIRAIHVASEP